jgi:hypothetical protein
MKVLIALLAVAGLSGCVAYGVPYGTADVHYSTGAPYYGGYYGGGVPYVIEQRPTYIYGGRGYYGRGYRDRDGDGIANRHDRDRDGDGVSNRRDAYPNNPRRH